VIEKNKKYGEETSSRNSEVIHGGMYYPIDSLKTQTCIKGRKMLYDLCQRYDIPHKKVGKWIFASQSEQLSYLQELKKKSDMLGIPLRFLTKKEITEGEPNLKAVEALESPETGIIDSHQYMTVLADKLVTNDGILALQTRLTSVEKTSRGTYIVTTQINSDAEVSYCTFETESIVNCAGLHADKVSEIILGEKVSEYKLYPCRGHYFGYSGKPTISRLIYPIPDKALKSLGLHATIDLAGKMKFGPDLQYVEDLNDYSVDEALRDKFYETVKSYLPSIEYGRLHPDYAGMRPKLAGPNDGFKDFIVNKEDRRGHPQVVNLVGIESPGLTGSLALGEIVAGKLGYKECDSLP
jgi:L-2-hydroxyglutarate oxidase LhgO